MSGPLQESSERRARELFVEALGVPVEGRGRHLEDRCAGDDRLRQVVHALLEAVDRLPSAFLSGTPAADTRAELRGRLEEDEAAGGLRSLGEYLALFPGDPEAVAVEFLRRKGRLDAAAAPGPTASGLPSRYRLIRELGRGGQGVVHLAEDRHLHRFVAVKRLDVRGAAPKEILERFRREAEVTSKLNHPGICTVYEAGEDGDAPYIVMHYIEGATLAQRIAAAKEARDPSTGSGSCLHFDPDPDAPATPVASAAPARDRTGRSDVMRNVALFEQAALALHAAHEAGVVHRDIKPGNIMVAATLQPVLMDFGLARQEDSDLPTLTRTGELFGTPAYMSPEQLTRHGIRLDRRTDIWSLGVSLYECLTLRRPFEAPTREGIYQAILTSDPPDPCRLNPAIPADLRVVIETALEKNRDRRYQTGHLLAEDLRRLRERKPIAARPAGLYLRLARWCQRNPAIASAVIAAFVCLAAGLGTTLVQKVRAETAEAAAVEKGALAESRLLAATAAEAAAKTAAADAGAVTGFLSRILALANPEVSLSPDVPVRLLLDRAGDEVAKVLDGRPRAEASVRATIGTAWTALGAYEKAEGHLLRALRLQEDDPTTSIDDLYATLRGLAPALAEREDRRAGLMHERLAGLIPPLLARASPPAAAALARGMDAVGKSRVDLVAAPFEEARKLAQASLVPGDPAWLVLSDGFRISGQSLVGEIMFPTPRVRLDLAEPILREALRIRKVKHAAGHPEIVYVMFSLIDCLLRTERGAEAEPLAREALAALERVLPGDHSSVVGARESWARCLAGTGRHAEALALFQDVVPKLKASVLARSKVRKALAAWVRCAEAAGEHDAAGRLREELCTFLATALDLPVWSEVLTAFDGDHPAILSLLERVFSPENIVVVRDLTTSRDRALNRLLDELLPRIEQELAPASPLACLTGRMLIAFGVNAQTWASPASQRRLNEAALPLLRAWPPTFAFDSAHALLWLGLLDAEEAKWKSAESRCREISAIAGDGRSLVWWEKAGFQQMQGNSLVHLGRPEAGESLLLEARAAIVEYWGLRNPNSHYFTDPIVEMYVRWGKPEKAAPFGLGKAREGSPLPWGQAKPILSIADAGLAAALDALGQAVTSVPREIAARIDDVLRLRRERLPVDDPRAILYACRIRELAEDFHVNRGCSLAGWGAILDDALLVMDKGLAPPRHLRTLTMLRRIDAWIDAGELEPAEEQARAIFAAGRPDAMTQSSWTGSVRVEPWTGGELLARALLGRNRDQEAESVAREAWESARLADGDSSAGAIAALRALSLTLMKGKVPEYRRLWTEVLARAAAIDHPAPTHYALARWSLVERILPPEAHELTLGLGRKLVAEHGKGEISKYDAVVAYALVRLRRFDEALPLLEKLAEKFPKVTYHWAFLALARRGLGQADGAREAFERARSIDQDQIPSANAGWSRLLEEADPGAAPRSDG